MTDFVNFSGLGVEGVVDAVVVSAGRLSWLAERGVAIDAAVTDACAAAEAQGHTVVVGAWDGAARVVVAVADTIKPSSRRAIERVRSMGLRTVLLTGDNESAAQAVGADVGVDDVIAGVRPDGKLAAIAAMQHEAASSPWWATA